MTFRILMVCTGNICRSPLAEQLLRRELSGTDTEVSSAGTHALVGHPMDERAAAHSRRLGGDPRGHGGRQLTLRLLDESDLVLVATRRHRRAVVELLPRATRSAFTLRELARLLSTIDAGDRADIASTDDADERLRAVADVASSKRGVAEPPATPADDDVIDPYRQSDAVYDASVEQVVRAVQTIAPVLRGAVTRFEARRRAVTRTRGVPRTTFEPRRAIDEERCEP